VPKPEVDVDVVPDVDDDEGDSPVLQPTKKPRNQLEAMLSSPELPMNKYISSLANNVQADPMSGLLKLLEQKQLQREAEAAEDRKAASLDREDRKAQLDLEERRVRLAEKQQEAQLQQQQAAAQSQQQMMQLMMQLLGSKKPGQN